MIHLMLKNKNKQKMININMYLIEKQIIYNKIIFIMKMVIIINKFNLYNQMIYNN